MEPISAGLLAAQALFGLGKAVFGGSKKRKAERQMQQGISNLPKYTTPESYNQLLSVMRKNAGLPSEYAESMRDEIGAQQAGAIRNINKAAPSSVAALGATEDAYGRTISAVRDFGRMAYQWQANANQALANAYQQGIGIENMAYQQNQLNPAMMRLNLAGEKYQEGQQEANQGFNMFASGLANLGIANSQYGGLENPFKKRPTMDNYVTPIQPQPLPTGVNPFTLTGNYGG